jgi:hypothetical protein
LTGTVRSQVQLRPVFASTNTHVLLRPEVLVAYAREIPNQRFASAHDARTILAGAPVATLNGTVKGSAV